MFLELLFILGLCILIALLGFLAFCGWILVRERMNILVKSVPGPTICNPLFGSILEGHAYETVFQRWSTYVSQYGRMYRYYSIFGKRWIVTTDPKALKHILVSNSKNYVRGPLTGVETFKKIVGETSMLVTDGEIHRRHRQVISPAFKISNIRRFVPLMQQSTKVLMDNWINNMENDQLKQIDIRRSMSRVTMHIIGCIAFGFDFGCNCPLSGDGTQNENSDVVNALEQIVSVGTNGGDFKVWHFLPILKYLPIKKVRELWAGIGKLHSICDSMIQIRKQSNQDEDNKNVLDFILSASEDCVDTNSIDEGKGSCPMKLKLDNTELKDEMMTFILAGHETSSLALTWTLWFLCAHQRVQEKCRQEVQTAFGPDIDTSTISFEDLSKLEYTKAVIYESLRLMPPIPFFPRTSTEQDSFAGFNFPVGTSFGILIAHAARLPEVWGPDVKMFRPERFLEPDVPWDAWLPFGDGPHKCLGYQFALTEMTLILAMLVNKFQFTMRPEMLYVQMQVIVTMTPTQPILVDIERI